MLFYGKAPYCCQHGASCGSALISLKKIIRWAGGDNVLGIERNDLYHRCLIFFHLFYLLSENGYY